MNQRGTKADWPEHGGQGLVLLQRLGLAGTEPRLDLSASLNPLGPPDWLADWLKDSLESARHYPDPGHPAAYAALAAALGLGADRLLLTNGGAEAIHLVASAYRGGRALIVEPTFGEYARACALNGIAVERYELNPEGAPLDIERLTSRLDASADKVDLIFLCRPNNPTGACMAREDVVTLLEAARRRGALVVVDEAFVDFADPGMSLTALVDQGLPLILLRSLTKFYALAGLRLGYLVASASCCRRLQRHQPAWSVNGLASALVPALLADTDFASRTRDWVMAERAYLPLALGRLGLVALPTQANFVLFRPPGAPSRAKGEGLVRHLARDGVLVRHTHTFAGLDGAWVRVALQQRQGNQLLIRRLEEWRDSPQAERWGSGA
ncbi:threonine-phosphate decarboxylase CobD [Halomonas sp. DP8Y7-1]|uniref:threonine-phosphate decarboxylase CobD n=1 Tax=Halomonas sp. DP8Y7-1 TaxID=2859078 RepID=UPI001C93AFDD|nr:threonine-phosphate decarboxylase CobD [Halomonas sp. DP8Y7-1]MBY6030920.1 threonine-phosphate decarboxylase CobD [Halomonas sp. DP8Y7-1]MED5297332.1 threonine-phosphate decarboxylase CobD [Pseudomonadota bacterium]